MAADRLDRVTKPETASQATDGLTPGCPNAVANVEDDEGGYSKLGYVKPRVAERCCHNYRLLGVLGRNAAERGFAGQLLLRSWTASSVSASTLAEFTASEWLATSTDEHDHGAAGSSSPCCSAAAYVGFMASYRRREEDRTIGHARRWRPDPRAPHRFFGGLPHHARRKDIQLGRARYDSAAYPSKSRGERYLHQRRAALLLI
jgi:hypothetical protein